MLVRRLQRVAGLQGRLLACKKQATALLSAAKSERSRRLAQVQMVLALADTYDHWRLEVHHRNCFYDALLAQVLAPCLGRPVLVLPSPPLPLPRPPCIVRIARRMLSARRMQRAACRERWRQGLMLLWQAEMVSAWVQGVVDKEEERRMEFLERMQAVLPQPLLQLLHERPLSRGGGIGHARAPRMEVHVSARAKRLPIVHPPLGALDAASLLVPLVSARGAQSDEGKAPNQGHAPVRSPGAGAASSSVEANAERHAALEAHVANLE